MEGRGASRRAGRRDGRVSIETETKSPLKRGEERLRLRAKEKERQKGTWERRSTYAKQREKAPVSKRETRERETERDRGKRERKRKRERERERNGSDEESPGDQWTQPRGALHSLGYYVVSRRCVVILCPRYVLRYVPATIAHPPRFPRRASPTRGISPSPTRATSPSPRAPRHSTPAARSPTFSYLPYDVSPPTDVARQRRSCFPFDQSSSAPPYEPCRPSTTTRANGLPR